MRDRRRQAKAKQVYLILRDRILTGAIAFGAKLPTENELAEVHGMSRAIIRRAHGGVPSDQMLQRSVRARSVVGEPLSYLTTCVAKSISLTFTQQELASQPVLDLLERAGVKHPRQRISAELAAPDIGSWSAIARQSRTAGDTASTTRRLITRSKPPDLRAALGEGVHHVGY